MKFSDLWYVNFSIAYIIFFPLVLQSTPNYHEEKYRYEYLHKKLAHIKRLIGEFDQQQAETWH